MNENEILKNYLFEKNKNNAFQKYGPDITNQMGIAVMAMGFSEHFAQETHTDSFNNILMLLKESRDKNKILPILTQIIDKNFAIVKATYEQLKKETFDRILDNKLEEYIFLSQQPNKKDTAIKIKNACFKNKAKKALVEKYDMLEKALRMFDPKMIQLTPKALKIRIDDNADEILLGLASIIDDPSRLAYQREILDPDYDKFPLKWYGLHMSIVDFRKYFRRFKAGENIDDYVEQYVDSRLEYIKQLFNNHYFNQFAKRAEILKSMIETYSAKNYPATICTCLPLIEGSIMKFAEYYHFYSGGIFIQQDHKKFLLLKTGSQKRDFTIGDLLKNSALSTFFDDVFITYFCNDLYNERNPILHGTEVEVFNKLNAAKKILTFDYVVKVMDKFIFERYQKDMDEAMDDEIYEKLTTGGTLNDVELARFHAKIEEIEARRFIS